MNTAAALAGRWPGVAAAPSPNEGDVAIDIRGLSFRPPSRNRDAVEILSGIDLAVRQREFIAIVGPSGCGKSTLLNFVAGLLPVQSGQVTVRGQGGQAPSLGYVFQQHGLLPWRTAQKNVELGLEIAGLPVPQRQERARAMLAQMGLAGYERHYPRELSGGMRQRVALAKTLVTEPQVVLMDEPFGALDAQTRVAVQSLFAEFWTRHRATVLFVTHDIDEALLLADRVVVMGARPGRIVAQYTVPTARPRSHHQLRQQPAFNELYDTLWNDIAHLAQDAGRPAARRPS
jgi:NitT/TauT family transport system ATP-binding protein